MRENTTIKKVIDKEYKLFYEQSILKFREENLVNENQEFADILQEYRDGLLLFELMEKEIWNKAQKDTTGLEEYYNKNVSKYVWKDRVDVVIASTSNKTMADKVQTMLNGGKSNEDIESVLNTDKNQNVIFTSGLYEISNPKLPKDLKITKGISEIYQYNEGFHVLKVNDVLPTENTRSSSE